MTLRGRVRFLAIKTDDQPCQLPRAATQGAKAQLSVGAKDIVEGLILHPCYRVPTSNDWYHYRSLGGLTSHGRCNFLKIQDICHKKS